MSWPSAAVMKTDIATYDVARTHRKSQDIPRRGVNGQQSAPSAKLTLAPNAASAFATSKSSFSLVTMRQTRLSCTHVNDAVTSTSLTIGHDPLAQIMK
jgi:hypothetical protein